MNPLEVKRRRLPHVYPDHKPLFITWNLRGSMPRSMYPPPGKFSAGRAFVWIDRYLDTKQTGPRHLQNPEIAKLVVEAIRRGEDTLGHYELHAYVVMPNHVHLLITAKVVPSRLLQSLKGFTAREANLVIGRTGNPFWQRECYDHWVRNQTELERIRQYIEWNPVKAGLCSRPEEFPWSSAAKQVQGSLPATPIPAAMSASATVPAAAAPSPETTHASAS
jgi:REP element-mobilizing transposase RayT